MTQADIGLIGLAVMGQNLVLNMADHGYQVVVFNRTISKVDTFLAGEAKDKKITGSHSLEEFFQQLKRPRKVMLMVKAGAAVDHFIDLCLPHMEKGDILIDGGNSLFSDSSRRFTRLEELGIAFIGAGVSGGEEGARHGPSIMPGGDEKGWPAVQGIFQSISAQVEGDPCCDWIGTGGAGHYVKMVHNGIEYGDMQLICEAYHILKMGKGHSNENLHTLFTEWNRGELDSYLIEISAKIFAEKGTDGAPLLDKILDTAGQKGTGKWTAIDALEMGMPLTLIGEAVFSRCLSALKKERVHASSVLVGPDPTVDLSDEEVRQALYGAKIVSYAQGFMLMRESAKFYGWELNYGQIAKMWRGGCIIRSRFLNDITAAYQKNPQLDNLMLDPFFKDALALSMPSLRKVVAATAISGIPAPCFSAALSFYDGYRSSWLPANLLQAQRDFFGAHTYERIDHPRGEFFHTEWGGVPVNS